jgi:hypothetical protein
MDDKVTAEYRRIYTHLVHVVIPGDVDSFSVDEPAALVGYYLDNSSAATAPAAGLFRSQDPCAVAPGIFDCLPFLPALGKAGAVIKALGLTSQLGSLVFATYKTSPPIVLFLPYVPKISQVVLNEYRGIVQSVSLYLTLKAGGTYQVSFVDPGYRGTTQAQAYGAFKVGADYRGDNGYLPTYQLNNAN